MRRILVILACSSLLLAGVEAGSVGARTDEATYSLVPSEGAAVHDRAVTIDGTDVEVESVVGINPGEETRVRVIVPDNESAAVTLRSPEGDVLQRDSVTDGAQQDSENVVINSTGYEAGTYQLVLSAEDQIRAVALVVVSEQRVSFDVGNVTDGSVPIGVTVPGGIDDGQRVQFVLSNGTETYRTNVSEVRNGLYEATASLDGIAAGNYTGYVAVVEETNDGSGEVLSATRAKGLLIGGNESVESVESGANETSAAEKEPTATLRGGSPPVR